ncbi:MAG TPA: MotA/TolQ/ExbB proton channel family protein [Candidatus Sulfotelmatobacter sp.]|jgi:biopolymer transport protein TolQ|nr:MotA/TolQ/ExbB proton channel family protein [Candidatus Sulfotelmatobacter sp.]
MPAIDLSLSAIYLQASGPVQAVLLILMLCSVVCWSIILEKAVLLIGLFRQVALLEQAAGQGDVAVLGKAALGRVLGQRGREESQSATSGESAADRHARLERALCGAVAGELLKAERRLAHLATIGSSAPFIGLFGTVWGVMHSFASIAQSNDTSLAVVAPGIAEALSTTAIGLAAAIPASIAYNKLAGDFGTLSRRVALAMPRLVRYLDAPGASGARGAA